MATANFCLNNASRYFVYEPQDEWEYDDLKLGIEQTAISQGWDSINNDYWLNDISRAANRYMRDFYGAPLKVFKETEFTDRRGNSWHFEIVPLMRSGYYSGCNLDFHIEMSDPYDRLDNEDLLNEDCVKERITDWAEYIEDHLDEPIMQSDEAGELLANINKCIDELVSAFNRLGESTADEYIKYAQFSNGEAMYLNKSELERRNNQSKAA